MIGRTNAGGGGSGGGGVNFKVVGSATQPGNPSENTIWVNTSASITGWAMQGSAPSGSEGLVWIKTALTGNTAFNALKKNAIQIAVTGCQQYVSGSWANVAAQIWQSDAWVEFSTENLVLFEAGAGDSGKWTNSGFTYGSYSVGGGTVSDASLSLTATMTPDYTLLGTATAYDLTNYTNLHIECSFALPSSGYGGLVSVVASTSTNLGAQVVSQDVRNGTSFDIDVSSLSGAHYIGFYGAGSSAAGSGGTLTVTKVYLE